MDAAGCTTLTQRPGGDPRRSTIRRRQVKFDGFPMVTTAAADGCRVRSSTSADDRDAVDMAPLQRRVVVEEAHDVPGGPNQVAGPNRLEGLPTEAAGPDDEEWARRQSLSPRADGGRSR